MSEHQIEIERQIAEQGETDAERLMWDRYDD